MEFDLSVPEIHSIAIILSAQAGISDCDPDDPCDCPCNCLQIHKVVVTVHGIIFTTRLGTHHCRLVTQQLIYDLADAAAQADPEVAQYLYEEEMSENGQDD